MKKHILVALTLAGVAAADLSLATPSHSDAEKFDGKKSAFHWNGWMGWKPWGHKPQSDWGHAKPPQPWRPHPPPAHRPAPTAVPELSASGAAASAFLLAGLAAVATGTRRRKRAGGEGTAR